MPNPTISTITLPSGTTYDIADLAARAAAAGINMVKCTAAADTPKGVKWDNEGTTVTGTLEASSSTTGKFYLVPTDTSSGKDVFAEYVTVVDSTNYSWEKIGTTDIDLSNLGTLAYKNSASGSFTPSGSVTQPTFTGTTKKLAFSGTNATFKVDIAETTSTGNFTPIGTINVNSSTGAGTSYTPEGSIAVNASTGTGTAYTPEGTVSQPTFSGAKKYIKFTGTQGSVSVSGSVSGTGSITGVGTGIDMSQTAQTGYKQVLTAANITTSEGTSIGIGGSIEVNDTTGSGTTYQPGGVINVNDSSSLSGTSYTPAGTVSTPTISVKTAGSTASITPFGSAGTLPSLSMTVQDGNLTIGFDQGTLPSAGTAVTVKTSDAAYQSSQPTFNGTEKKFAFSGTPKKLNFAGTPITVGVEQTPGYIGLTTSTKSVTISSTGNMSGNFTPSGSMSIGSSSSTGAAEYTPEGTVSQPTFSGTSKKLAFSGTAKKLAFSGTQGSVSVKGTPNGVIKINGDGSSAGTTYTPAGTINVNDASGSGTAYTPGGTVSQPTFSGTSGNVTVS